MAQEGLLLTVTHAGINSTSVLLADIEDGFEARGYRRPGPVYVPAGGSITLDYTSSVAMSFENGDMRAYITSGHVTAAFVVGPTLAAAIGGGGSFTMPPNTVLVDPSEAEVVGERYQTVAAAQAYVATQAPGANNIWGIKVSGVVSEDITVGAHVYILGERGAILTGAVRGGTPTTFDEYLVKGCRVDDFRVDTAGTIINFSECTLTGGTASAPGLITLQEGLVSGGDFTSLALCYLGNSQVSGGTFGEFPTSNLIFRSCLFQDSSPLVLAGGDFYCCSMWLHNGSATFNDGTYRMRGGTYLRLPNPTTFAGGQDLDWHQVVLANTVLTLSGTNQCDLSQVTGDSASLVLNGAGVNVTTAGCATLPVTPTVGTWTNYGDTYDNRASGLASTNTQDAIDEILATGLPPAAHEATHRAGPGGTDVIDFPFAGQELHVDGTNGDDTWDGKPTSPFATIHAAISASSPNDLIIVHAGYYIETLSLPMDRWLKGTGGVSIQAAAGGTPALRVLDTGSSGTTSAGFTRIANLNLIQRNGSANPALIVEDRGTQAPDYLTLRMSDISVDSNAFYGIYIDSATVINEGYLSIISAERGIDFHNSYGPTPHFLDRGSIRFETGRNAVESASGDGTIELNNPVHVPTTDIGFLVYSGGSLDQVTITNPVLAADGGEGVVNCDGGGKATVIGGDCSTYKYRGQLFGITANGELRVHGGTFTTTVGRGLTCQGNATAHFYNSKVVSPDYHVLLSSADLHSHNTHWLAGSVPSTNHGILVGSGANCTLDGGSVTAGNNNHALICSSGYTSVYGGVLFDNLGQGGDAVRIDGGTIETGLIRIRRGDLNFIGGTQVDTPDRFSVIQMGALNYEIGLWSDNNSLPSAGTGNFPKGSMAIIVNELSGARLYLNNGTDAAPDWYPINIAENGAGNPNTLGLTREFGDRWYDTAGAQWYIQTTHPSGNNWTAI